MTPTDRLHRRFHSPESLGTKYRFFLAIGVFDTTRNAISGDQALPQNGGCYGV
ncbi:hypothetical protein [Microseira sp. BLCC-F43]|uniref:hypothetical protein n=1 Tax=Microseira sp. BLCC-F43 TaxID=3153602 RepID=UPI0035BB8168